MNAPDAVSRRGALLLTLAPALSSGQPAPLPDARRRELSAAFWEPVNLAMVRWLAPGKGDRVLDAGCGYGDHAVLFASQGQRVVALDINPDATSAVRRRAADENITSVLETRVGDIQRLPFENASFDLAWSSHVLHGQADFLNAARELRRVVRPGGRVVVREDKSTTSFLPYDLGIGKPGLEFRMRKAFLEWFLEDRLKRGRCPFGWATVLRQAGLRNVQTKSFLHEVPQPFSADQSAFLGTTLARALEDPRLPREDRATLRRLLNTDAPESVFRRDDLHFTAITTLYVGLVA